MPSTAILSARALMPSWSSLAAWGGTLWNQRWVTLAAAITLALWIAAGPECRTLTIVVLPLMAAMLALPGLCLQTLLTGSPSRSAAVPTPSPFNLSFTIYSVGFYAAFYALLMAVPEYVLNTNLSDRTLALLWTSAMIGLGAFAWRRDPKLSVVRRIGRDEAVALGLVAGAAFMCLVYISWNFPHPLFRFVFADISQQKTLRLILTHDNYFQFINAIAISHQEPFAKYYDHGALVYPVEAREMLAGVLFATINRILTGFHARLADLYMLYEIMAILLDLVFLFPLVWLARRYFPRLAATGLMVPMFLNAFLIMNIIFAWFKLAGAGFALVGMACLLADPERLRSWLLAGLAFAIAANFHASCALGLPLPLAYVAYGLFRRGRLRHLTTGATLLMTIFLLGLYPWTWVKGHFLHDEQVLIRQNFIGNHRPEGPYPGLLASVLDFWRLVPLSDQLSLRLSKLLNTFHFDLVREIWDLARAGDLRGATLLWAQREARYTIFFFYPLLVLGGAWLLLAQVGRGARRARFRLPPEARAMLLLTTSNFLLLIVLAYTNEDPDMTYHQPMALLLIPLLIIAGWLQSGPQWVRRSFALVMDVMFVKTVAAYVITQVAVGSWP